MLLLLAVLCPPLAVLAVGRPSRAAVNLGLTSLLYFPGLVHALAAVDHYQTGQRNEALLEAVSRHYA
jgi:uncharacterized membrane protein YqaE (UPF0057 family)